MTNNINKKVFDWWQSLFLPAEQLLNRGIKPAPSSYKARLKRCDSLDAVVMTDGFRALWLSLDEELSDQELSKKRASEQMLCFAAIAAILVFVKTNTEKKLAIRAGLKEDNKKSLVSELRFSQLQSTQTPDDLIRRLRRVLQQVDGKANVHSLVVDIRRWFFEYYTERPKTAGQRITVEWAMDYYRAANAK